MIVHAAHALVYSVWITVGGLRGGRPRPRVCGAQSRRVGRRYTFFTVTLPLAAPGIIASAIFVFLESLDEFTGTFFVGVPNVSTLPLLLYSASMGGNYQIASITALILLVPSILFMLFVERFLKADVLSKIGRVNWQRRRQSDGGCGAARHWADGGIRRIVGFIGACAVPPTAARRPPDTCANSCSRASHR